MKLNDFEFDSFIEKGIDNVQFTNFTPTVAQQEMFDRLNSEIEDYNTRVCKAMQSYAKLCKDPITDINIPSYHEPSITKTEAGKGGTMIYVAKGLNFKPRKDIEIYQSKDLESTFIEVINPKESIDIVGVIYRHPNMSTTEFTDHKLNDLMLKLSLEQNKKIYIAGDFNFDLLKTSTHSDTSNFYNKISSNFTYTSNCLTHKDQ